MFNNSQAVFSHCLNLPWTSVCQNDILIFLKFWHIEGRGRFKQARGSCLWIFEHAVGTVILLLIARYCVGVVEREHRSKTHGSERILIYAVTGEVIWLLKLTLFEGDSLQEVLWRIKSSMLMFIWLTVVRSILTPNIVSRTSNSLCSREIDLSIGLSLQ